MQNIQHIEVEDSCPEFCCGKKLSDHQQAQLWSILRDDPTCPSRLVLETLAEQADPLSVSIRHVNRWRRTWGLQRKKGRPRRATTSPPVSSSSGQVVHMTPHLSYVGVHLFAAWLDEEGLCEQLVQLLEVRIHQYRAEYPDAEFPLLHHTHTTLLHRVQAVLYAPLFGIHKLTGYDVIEHPLDTVLGGSYQSSTLNQFLGQLERIDAGDALLPALLPKNDVSETPDMNPIGTATATALRMYIDGHMIGLWSTVSLHKGKITMLGRIMAGSQAVVTHNQDGQAVFVAYQPPDIRMPRFILSYCQQLVAVTGVDVFVIDREVNSVALAREFHEAGLGLLSMLDRNQYNGLSSWQVTRIGECADGCVVYEGQWATPRPDDPRYFVLVDTGERVIAYWGTLRVKEQMAPITWPEVYRQRTHLQEHRFQDMKAYGALDVNFGTKKIWGPDRHQERKREKLTGLKEKKAEQVEKKTTLMTQQEAKVAESQARGHTTRLAQRQRRLLELEQEITQATAKLEQAQHDADAVGEPRQRADRDFRKQLIMTIRTLLLDNALRSFLATLIALMPTSISVECLLKLLFQRSGIRLETAQEYVYWINTAGLSAAYRNTLAQIVTGLCAMNLTYQGKPIRVRVKEAPS